MSNIICGTFYSDLLLKDAKKVICHLQAKYSITPGLCIILVGDNFASTVYVKNKIKKAQSLGIEVHKVHLETQVSEDELIKVIQKFNLDPSVHGIIVQLPLPEHINKNKVLNAITLSKDVDGLSNANSANLYLNLEGLIPCTPLACIKLIKTQIENLCGVNVTIIGRSQLVGLPLALLLLHNNATINLCHSHTKNLESITQNADVIITAIGKAKHFTAKYFSNKSIIIDVGINYIQTQNLKQIIGDVDFQQVKDKVKAITPVPGGVGPMTVAYLLINTIKAACIRCQDESYVNLY